LDIRIPRRENLETHSPVPVFRPRPILIQVGPNPTDSSTARLKPDLRQQRSRLGVILCPSLQPRSNQHAILGPSLDGHSAIVAGLDLESARWSQGSLLEIAESGTTPIGIATAAQ